MPSVNLSVFDFRAMVRTHDFTILPFEHSRERESPDKLPGKPLGGDEDLGAQHGAAGEASAPGDGGCRAARVEGARYPAEQRGHAAAVNRGSGVLGLRQQQPKRSARTDDEITARNRVDGAVLVAVEEQLDVVLLAHVQRVL